MAIRPTSSRPTATSETVRTAVSGARPKKLLEWQLAIFGSQLPATTRHILLTLAVRMDWREYSCFPSLDVLEKDSGLARSTLCRHIAIANEAGWINVGKRGTTGQKWRLNCYYAWIPEGHRTDRKRGSAAEPRSNEEAVRLEAEAGSADAPKAVRQSHSNSVKNKPLNSAGPSARDQGAAPAPASGDQAPLREGDPVIASPSLSEDDREAWQQVRVALRRTLGEARFNSWFAGVTLVATDPAFVLSVETAFISDRLRSPEFSAIPETLNRVFKTDRPIEWRVRHRKPIRPRSNPSDQTGESR